MARRVYVEAMALRLIIGNQLRIHNMHKLYYKLYIYISRVSRSNRHMHACGTGSGAKEELYYKYKNK